MLNEQIIQKIKEMQELYHDLCVDELQELWGENYAANTRAALLVARFFGGDEFANYLDITGKGDDPILVKFCYDIYEAIKDLGIIPGSEGGVDVVSTMVH